VELNGEASDASNKTWQNHALRRVAGAERSSAVGNMPIKENRRASLCASRFGEEGCELMEKL
jgi:hypothetical protein